MISVFFCYSELLCDSAEIIVKHGVLESCWTCTRCGIYLVMAL